MSPCPDDLKTLVSLDVVQGIRRIGGNSDAYRKQLHRFLEHYPNAVQELRNLIAANDLTKAEELCHALKGVSGNLGANDLFAVAVAVEVDALLKQDLMPSADQLQRMEKVLNHVLAEIAGLDIRPKKPMQRIVANSDASSADILDCLKQLREVLEGDLGAAEPVLVKLQGMLTGSLYENAFAEIAVNVDRFAIDDAQLQIAQLSEASKHKSLISSTGIIRQKIRAGTCSVNSPFCQRECNYAVFCKGEAD